VAAAVLTTVGASFRYCLKWHEIGDDKDDCGQATPVSST
jgi:hypothetical protein